MSLSIVFDRTRFLTETDETPGVDRNALVKCGVIDVAVSERRWRARRECRVEVCGITCVWKRDTAVLVPCETLAKVIRATLAELEITGLGVTSMPSLPATYGEE